MLLARPLQVGVVLLASGWIVFAELLSGVSTGEGFTVNFVFTLLFAVVALFALAVARLNWVTFGLVLLGCGCLLALSLHASELHQAQ